MTHARTRARIGAGVTGVLLAAGSAAVAAADAYFRPTKPPGAQAIAAQESENPPGSEIEPTVTCGKERWDVKTGTDAEAQDVQLQPVKHTTITKLGALPAPHAPTSRAAPVEDTVYEVNATLTAYKREDDSDYHLAIESRGGATMIAEIPLPACAIGSRFTQGITDARASFDANLKATGRFKHVHLPVKVSGIGFFDKIHGQLGVAPNGIELHPVLSISFGN